MLNNRTSLLRFATTAGLLFCVANTNAVDFGQDFQNTGDRINDAIQQQTEAIRAMIPSITQPVLSAREPEWGGGNDEGVVIYTLPTCGYCRQAKAYLHRRGVAFQEYDVQSSARGRRDYQAMKGRGVPIVLVGNERMDGYSEAKMQSMLEHANAKKAAPDVEEGSEQALGQSLKGGGKLKQPKMKVPNYLE